MDFGIGISAITIILAVIVGAAGVISRYRKCGPEEALIITNRKTFVKNPDGSTGTVNFKVIRTGGTLVRPVIEGASRMSLHSRSIPVKTTGAMSKEGVEIDIEGTALIKVAGDDARIINAAERFLNRESDIDTQAKEVLDGTLRGVCGTLTPEDIYRDRVAFQNKVEEQVQSVLSQMGLLLDVLTLRTIGDREGYFDALGKKRTAEVKRDALIGEADAERESAMRRAEAKRDSDMRVAQTQAEVAEAEKSRDVRKAQYHAETEREDAIAAQANPKAKAKAEQEVAEALAELAKKRAVQREEELISEIVKPAEANKRKLVLEAEADRDSRRARAEAENYEKEQEGIGEAAQIRSVKNAEAEGITAVGLAEAEAIKAKLVAEADGWEKRAAAMKLYSDAAMNLEIAQRLIDKLPDMVAAGASALAAVDKIEIFDFGGDGEAASNIAGFAPRNVMQTLTWLKQTTGVDLAGLLKGLTKGESDANEPVSVEESARPR
ncbi:MAG: hypothetical protein A3B96_02900 [Candidatus Spechtbacteria bacterium RIFCSPHIGHO2_02_FULL_43_15b]|nr:MAG: hypothetical protein A3B96_02900 [Candidatus Spechtbacteria bacterium RIFCSPHIGHO2_02_FULL_43_15b]